MPVSVLNNVASLAAQGQLTITNSNLQKALFQLSSGSRINTGADDAAGLAIADGLHANITALSQSSRNANDGVGELQVADGSLAQVTTLLNRAITLATEAATGTVSDPQRVQLDAEYTAIKAEVDRIGAKTNYNAGAVFTTNTLSIFLSDGGATSNSTIGVTTGLLSSTSLSLGGALASTATLSQAAGAGAVAASDVFTGATFTGATAATGTLTSSGVAANNDTVAVGGTTYTFKTALTASTTANEVLIGANAAASITNLKAAINGTGTSGTDYGSLTAVNTNVTGGTATATTLVVTAKVNGTAGNALTSVGNGGTFTFGGANLATGAAGDTVALGGKTYTFVTALSATATANEVVTGGLLATSLTNLTAAVNGTAGGGTTYGTGTTANTQVTAGTTTATTIAFAAITAGTTGNAIAPVVTGGHGTFATANFAGGAAGGAAPVAAAGNTITVGSQTYTFVAALNATPTANEVLVGATEQASLLNLANAVNGGSGSGATYGSTTVTNTSASAAAGASSVVFTAKTTGTAGNSLASSVTGTANTFAGANFTGGAAGSVNDLLSVTDATAALATINTAIQTVAALRGTIGATVNRLQSAANVINNQVQNLTGAEDGVRAADIPSTVATLAKYSILEQTGISALAQANQQQQLILKLLQ
jgi:flagellin